MNASDRLLDKLIEILYSERGETPPKILSGDKRKIFRALCNVRPPIPASEEFIELQDEYLTALSHERGIVDCKNLRFDGGAALWLGDLTRLNADGIVNACNSALLGCFQPLHECIDNAVHSYAGVQVRLDCNEIMHGELEKEGQVKVTKAYNLPSKFIFHTVGPQIAGMVTDANAKALEGCYLSCIEKALSMKLETLAFCCISTGVYGYPKRQAAEIAVRTALKHKKNLKIIFCVFDEETHNIYAELLGRNE